MFNTVTGHGITFDRHILQGRRVRGCGGSIPSLLPYKNATTIFLPVFDFEKIYIKILVDLRIYTTYNENIASFNVLHKPFMRIYQLF
jgi:hypothetical protein